MMKAGIETGSLINHLHSRTVAPEPKVGEGATILCWTDRHAATIVKVTPTQIHVQRDFAVRTDKHGMSDSQSYSYLPNPNGQIDVFRKTQRGFRNASGNGLLIGSRDHYYDYSF